MTIQPASETEKRFNLGAWLILAIAIAVLIFSLADIAYRFTLPTDGWDVNEAADLPGFNYLKDLMGSKSALQPGDQVIAIEGIPGDWQSVTTSFRLREIYQAGRSLDYTVLRSGHEVHVTVTLLNWQLGRWLAFTLEDFAGTVELLSVLILVALAGFIFVRLPGNPATGPFLLFMGILASSTISGTLPSGFSVWVNPIANYMYQTVNTYILILIVPFVLIRFAFVFPHPKPITKRYPWISWGIGAAGIITVFFTTDDSPIAWYWFVFSLFLAIAILIHNALTMRDRVSRAQLLWGLGGLIIGVGMLALALLAGTLGLVDPTSGFTDLFFSLVTSMALLVMGGMLAVAILRYRLYDIDVIIRKTLQYAILTGLLVLVYFGSVLLLQNLVETLTDEQSPIVIVLSTLGIAALFNPLRSRIQDFIDRRFYRNKYNAELALAEFASKTRDEVDLNNLSGELLSVVEKTIQPESISIWLKYTK
ncbi:MAG: hypothetical protein JSV42_15530 [Chloroflexota bacterium]|nr:MAG: hypothetical protein JSV42_15530 [Chloroflexota bacterium]